MMTREQKICSTYTKVFGQGWYDFLEELIQSDLFRRIEKQELKARANYTVYPEKKDLFRAFKETPLDTLKVIYVAQDPYHKLGRDGLPQATGLATGIRSQLGIGTGIPPTLRYIRNELFLSIKQLQVLSERLASEMDMTLEPWAHQGMLLLNRALSVKERSPGSHLIYWKPFTDYLIQKLSEQKEDLVFLLLGKKAQELIPLIDVSKHHIVKAAHPAAEAYKTNAGFIDSGVFQKVNEILKTTNKSPIEWLLNTD